MFKSYTLTTLFLGWWGTISLLMTPIVLISNIAEYLRLRRMPEPSFNGMSVPFGENPPSVASGSLKFKLIYGAIIWGIILFFVARSQVAFIEKNAPQLNAKLHEGEITDEADGEYAGVKIGKDISALESDYKGKDWPAIRSELLSREPFLSDLKEQDDKLQNRIALERNQDLGANDVCEQLVLSEMGPALQAYTAATENQFSFAKRATKLTPEAGAALQAITEADENSLKQLQHFYSDSDGHGCNK